MDEKTIAGFDPLRGYKKPRNMGTRVIIERTRIILKPDPSRVLIRFFSPSSNGRTERIIGRIMTLNEKSVKRQLKGVLKHFEKRHRDIERVFLRHYELVAPNMITDIEPSRLRKLLIGAYFTSEYSLESAALFNPSIVPHPDQTGLPSGSLRFILSLRATGEGHVSSLEFRQGVIDTDYRIEMEPPGDIVTIPERVQNSTYNKELFSLKLYELGFKNEIVHEVISELDDEFTLEELKQKIERRRKTS